MFIISLIYFFCFYLKIVMFSSCKNTIFSLTIESFNMHKEVTYCSFFALVL